LTRTEVFDTNHNPSKLIQKTEYDHNSYGDLKEEKDIYADNSPDSTTKYEYSIDTGNLIKSIQPNDTISEYDYKAQDSIDTETEKASNGTTLETTTTTYDELGRELTETITALNAPTEITTSSYSYDITRKVHITTETDESGGITVTETGWDGRVLMQRSPNGLTQVNTYYGSDVRKNGTATLQVLC